MKVFVAGPRAVNALNKNITDVLSRIVEQQLTVLLGDATGVDRLAQKYFADAKYSNVCIYASDGKARNNLGDWPIQKVEVPPNAKGFNFYAQKDIKMARDADNGFMIWNGKSKGTLNNIINLASQGKKVVVYLISTKKTYCFDNLDTAKKMAEFIGPETASMYQELLSGSVSTHGVDYEQISLSEVFK